MQDIKIFAFADEAATDIDGQIRALKRNGLAGLEIRGVDGQNISDITLNKAKEVKEKLDCEGLSVWSIGSPIGKIEIADDFEAHKEKLKRTLEIANVLDCKNIRMFSFFMPENEDKLRYSSEVIWKVGEMAKIAEQSGVFLCHENEKGIYGDTPEACLELFKAIPLLKGVFDPANFVQCGQKTYPDAYEMLKPYIEYMHIKDALANSDVVPAGMGEGCVYDILKALSDADYEGFLSLEPHLGSFEGLDALETDDKMTRLEKSSADKFTLAYESLMKIIERI